jgi:ElaB/YqjD/DUF883 family membrane-anchored ribosome-binding protein
MLAQPEVIAQQMEDTRASLAEKLETLEDHVVGTVTDATSAVADTVETVKEAVEETVEAVKGTVEEGMEAVKTTFDLPRHMDRHPWLFVGASVAVGYIGGRLLDRASSDGRSAGAVQEPASPAAAWPGPPVRKASTNNGHSARERAAPPPPHPQKPSWLTSLASQLEPEIARLKSLAIGTAMALARDAVVPSLPEELRPKVTELANNFTAKLGGEVIHGALLHRESTTSV